MPKINYLEFIGKKYHLLTIIGQTPLSSSSKRNRHNVIAKCECGNIGNYVFHKIKSGHTKSCGCYKGNIGKNFITHGLSSHPLYEIWSNMRFRCYNEKSPQFEDYGGRGVKICDEWKDNFKAFYNWAIENGWRKRMVIDKDIKAKKMGTNPLLYSPEWCSIITHKENSNCTQRSFYLEYKGEIKTASEWATITGINEGTIRYRKNNNWPIDKIFTVPPNPRNRLLK